MKDRIQICCIQFAYQIYMNEKKEDTGQELTQHYNELEVSYRPLKKQTNQSLLNKSPQKRESFQYEDSHHKQRNHEYQNKFDGQSSSWGYCYPRFLTKIGACCTPCKILCPCCFCNCCPCSSNPLFQQEMKSLGLLQQWGRFSKILQPGLHVINPISQSIIQVNQQTTILEYNQVAISKDNVQFQVSVAIFYRVIDSFKLAYRLGSVQASSCITQIATGTLRSVIGQNVLQSVIDNRELITGKFNEDLNRQLLCWGLYIEVCSLKQIRIHRQIQRALEAVTQTKRASESMLINFRAEVQCGKLIKQISEIINNPASFQIRYLNMVEGILAKNQQNVLFLKMQLDEEKVNLSELKQ